MIDIIIILSIAFISISFSRFSLAPEPLDKILYNGDFRGNEDEDSKSDEDVSFQSKDNDNAELSEVDKEELLDISEVDDHIEDNVYTNDIKSSSKNLIKEILRNE